MGPDGIHPRLLKECSREVSLPLQIIFSKSISTGVFPEAWRLSNVVPIFKGKLRCDPLNYRPVSLTSVCSKTMERIVARQIMDYLEVNDLLSPHQYGFRPGRSTEDQLILTYDYVSQCVDDGFVVDMIFLDFSKAFDLVNHLILLEKLSCLGIRGDMLRWIAGFLSNRSLSVVVDGSSSGERPVVSGVPQGSVLGPLLFLIYVNFLGRSLVTGLYKAFADDYKLYLRYSWKSLENVHDSVSALQSDLDSVSLVSSSWNLVLNPDKCVVMRFYRGHQLWEDNAHQYYLNGEHLKFVEIHKDLGVMVDHRLNFHVHVDGVVNRAWGLANNILRSTVCRSPSFMVALFISHIRPMLDYCSSVYGLGYVCDMRRLESVQRRWTKRVEGFGELDYSIRLKRLNLFSIKGRILRKDLINYWKIIRKGSDELFSLFTMAPNVGTRGHQYKLLMPFRCTEQGRMSFAVRRVRLWNALPVHVVEAESVTSFKGLLADALGDALFQYD